jgi:hypothetical protein
MRRVWKRSRRGLATIVTTAIMLTTVAIMGSGVVAWGHSNIFRSEGTIATSFSNNVNQINENLIIEKIWFCKNQSNCPSKPVPAVNITLNNQGSIGLNVTQIQFSTSTKAVQFHYGNQTILPQSTKSILIPYTYSSNVLTNIQVTTARGITISTQALPP